MAAAPRHHNNFGLLRLAFAAMVVLSHAPELVDGNRSREILTRLFGTLSFGEMGVDGFFLISGYLITKSYLSSPGIVDYLKKRVARIYPAFIVATLVSILVFAPLGGTDLAALGAGEWLRTALYAILLQPPPISSFAGTHYTQLNGAMWTIAYEFRCYLLVILLGLAGLLQRRNAVLALAVLFLLALVARTPIPLPTLDLVYGHPPQALRMTAAFLVGAVAYLYRDTIRFRPLYVIVAIVVLLCAMPIRRLAEPALLVCGGYIVFWLALAARPTLAALTARYDVSYGLYLYCWPIQCLLVYTWPTMSPWVMFAISLLASMAFGLASWLLVERHCLRWSHRRVPGHAKVK